MNTRGGTVPIVVSYLKVTKKPEIKRTRSFVGWTRVLKNMAIKAIELVEDLCYEVETEVMDAGDQQVVHWAIEVDNPWGCGESDLVAVRVPDKPACGAHFQIITIEDEVPKEEIVIPPTNNKPRPIQEAIRERLRKRMEEEGGIVR